MTKKDFELVARVVRRIDDDGDRDSVIADFVRELREINPRFDGARFARACGMSHGLARDLYEVTP